MKKKLTTLRWFDIIIVTFIMFGEGIYKSTLQYIALINHTTTLGNNLTFSSWQNYQALTIQSIWLFLAFIYLLWRNFDFSVWTRHIKIDAWLPLKVIGLFLISALAMDAYSLISYNLTTPPTPSLVQLFSNVDLSLILYSLLNGFYEEIFFLGVCLAIKPQHIKWAFLYSLLIRCSFHTYQGLGNAIALGLLLGSIFFICYRKWKPQNLLPFFLAHAIADTLGLTILSYILY
ncbi:CPBP family intramembrane metalloprotease [Streptococcus gallolyticus]|nr:CPBP family intramembrane metalloprotease [Streptococcus gallolyticus]MBY5040365.1 CPBP family intramembrane metalloprotease [Streptococcus gallolyticus]